MACDWRAGEAGIAEVERTQTEGHSTASATGTLPSCDTVMFAQQVVVYRPC